MKHKTGHDISQENKTRAAANCPGRGKRLLLTFVLLSAVIFAANLPASIRVGVDGRYKTIRMPLYVKWTEFLARHYEYARIAKEITAGCVTDKEKVLAIFKWTRQDLKDVPVGMPLCDDHVLYTIIRGYALPEQFQDVFTTICTYAGIPAFYEKPYDKNRETRYSISLVMLDGKWRVFDAYRGIYFRDKSGEIAAVGDIKKDPSLISGRDVEKLAMSGIPYKDFFYNLSYVSKPFIIRPQRQMPLPRLVYEVRKLLRMEREETN